MPRGSRDGPRAPGPRPAPDPGSQGRRPRPELFRLDGGSAPRSRLRARVGVPARGRALRGLLLGEEPVPFLRARPEHHAELRVPPWGRSARVGCGEEWVALGEDPREVQTPDSPFAIWSYPATVSHTRPVFFLL